MQPEELEAILRKTLDDFRFSRSERQALSERLQDVTLSRSLQSRCHVVAFELAREAIDPVNAQAVLDWLEDVSKVLRRRAPSAAADPAEAGVCFSPGDRCWSQICGMLRTTRTVADICVFTITDDRISAEILNAHRRGVALRVITDNEKTFDRGSDAERLAKRGVPVRVDRTPHHIFALFDNRRLLTGSYNWTRSAADHNEENFVITGDRRLIAPFEQEFERMWSEFAPL